MEKIDRLFHRVFTSLFIVFGFILTGCGSSVNTAYTEIAVETPSVTQMPFIPPLKPTLSSTDAISPNLSQESITPSRTPMTPIPMLSIEEQERYFLELLETNGNCQLPCFLGIRPGEVIWEDARSLEGPVYYRENYVPNDAGDMVIYTNLEVLRNFDLVFWGSKDVIKRIRVDARFYPDDPYEYIPAFANVMNQYSLENVLTIYGVPSRILLEVRGQVEQGAGTQTTIVLLYDEAGILIEYLFVDVVTQDSNTGELHTCLDYEHTYSIRLFLQNSEDESPLERMGEADYALSILLEPLVEVTELGIEDFYTIFTSPDKKACFDVP